MVSITVSVPQSVRDKMNGFPEMNWSGFVRQCIEDKTKELSLLEEMLRRVKQDEHITQWAVELQRKARKGHFAELQRQGLV